MFSFLDTWVSSKAVSSYNDFIIIQQPAQEDENWDDSMEYDFSDGRLWINRQFYYNFCDLFGMDIPQAGEVIQKWFEDRYKVEVKFRA